MEGEGARRVREGDVLAGRYRIDALIGEGGYGRVYRGTQIPMGREVAIKVVSATDDETLARFASEASIAQRLEHPNTVRLLDHGISPEGLPFLVLELLRGTSLHDLLERQGSLSPRIALEVTAQVLKSLAEAHALGIVHRDIKPENVFITSHFGESVFAKVLDFGIAKQTRGGNKLTVNGEAVGTPSYMAPEQTLGGEIDPRTDLYAVGLLLAEMITGRTVMDRGGAMTIMVAQASKERVPLTDDVRRSLVGPLVERAVQKLPADRYASAAEMLAAVLATMGDVDATGRAPTRHGGAEAPPPPTLPGLPAHLTLASPGPAPPSPATIGPVAPHAPPPAPPLAGRAAPARTFSVVAIAIIGVLSLAVVILLARELSGGPAAVRGGSRGGPRLLAPRRNEPEPLGPHVRLARVSQIPEVRRRLRAAGYDLTVDDGSAAAHTFAAVKLPCAGSVTIMTMTDEAEARRVARVASESSQGSQLLIEGRTVLTVGIASNGNGVDPACTEAVVSLLVR